jgi:hypothetical protein
MSRQTARQEFTIATPWDDAFLAGLEALNRAGTQACFAEVFGSHRASITGGGRPAFRLPEVTAERFEQHVRRATAVGLRFNYVMNAPDLAGLENDAAWRRGLLAFLEYLADCGVETLTIAHAALLELAKREFPQGIARWKQMLQASATRAQAEEKARGAPQPRAAESPA